MRLSQVIEYLNMENHPTQEEIDTIFTHITIDEDMKKLRRSYRRMLKKRERHDTIKHS